MQKWRQRNMPRQQPPKEPIPWLSRVGAVLVFVIAAWFIIWLISSMVVTVS